MPSSADSNRDISDTDQICIETQRDRKPPLAWAVGGAIFLIAIIFALFTNHAWEDFYITYRSSVNLAIGNGLVFTPGERVHSFTSPTNTLIPALLRYMVGEGRDQTVLWLYRILCALALGTSASMAYRWLYRVGFGKIALAVTLVFLGLESKVLDYTINGQEVAWMILCLILAVTALMGSGSQKRVSLWLGLAWTGAMYTRPDAFIYCAALASGIFLFPKSTAFARKELLKIYALATLGVIVLYMPWILWAWSYYGSPIPHTIMAKGLDIPHGILAKAQDHISQLLHKKPLSMSTSFVFMPAYLRVGGWPFGLLLVFKSIAYLAAFYWLVPSASAKGRALSFATLFSFYYLNYVPKMPAWWYFPNAEVFASLTVGFIVHDLYRLANHIGTHKSNPRRSRLLRCSIHIASTAMVTLVLTVTLLAARSIHYHQLLVEDGVRTKIGLWLKEHAASPRDTVFLECLGYIGYFSNLRMYDYPGLSSPEVVKARRKVGNDWAKIIEELKPDWLVLRPCEIGTITQNDQELLTKKYSIAYALDNMENLKQLPMFPGIGYLYYDIGFSIYKKNNAHNDPCP